MPSSYMCSLAMMCSSDADALSTAGKIIGIVVGSVVGLAFLTCIIIIIAMIFCKRKHHTQVWAYPCPRPQQAFEQSIPMYSYGGYPGVGLPTTRTKIIEEPPPAYEEIETIGQSTSKY